jgi:hypothetical protein
MAAQGEHKRGDILQGVGKVEAAENHHEDGEILIHSLEQPVEASATKMQPIPAGRSLTMPMRKSNSLAVDVADGRDCIVVHDHVDGPNNAEAQEQVKASCDSAWLVGRSHSATRRSKTT